ncbi:AAA family ATPase, partial [Streptomyces sp. NPDC001970]
EHPGTLLGQPAPLHQPLHLRPHPLDLRRHRLRRVVGFRLRPGQGLGQLQAGDGPSLQQRRRVAVATVLAMEPEILVLDEPSSNLDPASRRELVNILHSLDVTVLMVTHDQPYALELCPRSVILSEGVIAADGPTGGIVADEELMARHRLELPFGFVPSSAA